MCSLEQFKIDLKGQNEDVKQYSFDLSDSFFEALDTSCVHHGELKCELQSEKSGSYFVLSFHTEGVVHVACDRCLEDMEQPIATDDRLIVKFGQEYSEEDDVVTIVEDEGILDVSWFIYEFIVLNIPIQHVHAPGKCDVAMEKLLQEHAATRSTGGDVEETIDPRWSKLAGLKLD